MPPKRKLAASDSAAKVASPSKKTKEISNVEVPKKSTKKVIPKKYPPASRASTRTTKNGTSNNSPDAKSPMVKTAKTVKSPTVKAVSTKKTSPKNPDKKIVEKLSKSLSGEAENVAPQTVRVYVEACKSCHTYNKRANELFANLTNSLPDKKCELIINSGGKPRSGAFEIDVSKEGSDEKINVWTALKKGPPRRLKFPEIDAILPDITKALE